MRARSARPGVGFPVWEISGEAPSNLYYIKENMMKKREKNS
jgi:hypothetical protein